MRLRNKRNDGEPVPTMSQGQRIAVAAVGGEAMKKSWQRFGKGPGGTHVAAAS